MAKRAPRRPKAMTAPPMTPAEIIAFVERRSSPKFEWTDVYLESVYIAFARRQHLRGRRPK
jgi:hypothetical protein